MKNGFAPQPAVNGFAEQRLRAFVDDVVAPAEQQRQAADRAALMDWAGSTWPAVAAKAALSGAMLPGDVAQGKFSMDDPRAIERLTDMTGLITFGAASAPVGRNALKAGFDLEYFGQKIRILENPKPAELQGFLQKSKYKAARRLIDKKTGDVYVWDASDPALHKLVAEKLGIDFETAISDTIGLD